MCLGWFRFQTFWVLVNFFIVVDICNRDNQCPLSPIFLLVESHMLPYLIRGFSWLYSLCVHCWLKLTHLLSCGGSLPQLFNLVSVWPLGSKQHRVAHHESKMLQRRAWEDVTSVLNQSNWLPKCTPHAFLFSFWVMLSSGSI